MYAARISIALNARIVRRLPRGNAMHAGPDQRA
jgi:hypothetical protein